VVHVGCRLLPWPAAGSARCLPFDVRRDLRNNSLSGTLPDSITAMRNLTVM
jgi:hypothetical protein